jgi:DNA polymerase/3'-5' exonuclease PolX
MNSHLIQSFEALIADYRSRSAESSSIKFKIIAFSRTLKIIRSLNYEITDGEQLSDIKGIGAGTIARINDILATTPTEDTTTGISTLDDLTRITGIGPVKAGKLTKDGITLARLRQDATLAANHLTHHQLIGLKYLEDIEQRIPYAEIQKVDALLKKTARKLGLVAMVCGSYRRKQATSGDIDVLVSDSDNASDSAGASDSASLSEFVTKLTEIGFLIDHLTIDGATKYMGMAQYNKGTPRRIDIRYIKPEHVPTSMLYFTGSGEFNKNMRIYANRKGYKLNEYGLVATKIGVDAPPPYGFGNEKEIFEFLGLEYIEPPSRLATVRFNLI